MKQFFANKLFFQPLVSALLALALTFIISSDITSDSLLSTMIGSSDIEVSDFYNRIRAGGSQKHFDDEIVIVNIDSIFSREELGWVLLSLLENNPKSIGFDVLLQEDKDSVEDTFLRDVLESNPNIVASQKLEIHSLHPEEDMLSRNHSTVKRGMANLVTRKNSDMVREFAPFLYGDTLYPSLPAEMLRSLNPKSFEDLKKLNEKELIRFQPTEFYVVDANDIEDNIQYLDKKIIFVGTINEKDDLHHTPLSREYPGVMIQANILSMMLKNDYTSSGSETLNIILGLISCLGLSFLYVYLDRTQNLAMRIIPILWMFMVIFVGCWWFDSFGIYINAPQTLMLAAFSILVLDVWTALEEPMKKIKFRKK